MPERQPVQIHDDLWRESCVDAAEEVKKRRGPVNLCSKLRESLYQHFDKKNNKKGIKYGMDTFLAKRDRNAS